MGHDCGVFFCAVPEGDLGSRTTTPHATPSHDAIASKGEGRGMDPQFGRVKTSPTQDDSSDSGVSGSNSPKGKVGSAAAVAAIASDAKFKFVTCFPVVESFLVGDGGAAMGFCVSALNEPYRAGLFSVAVLPSYTH